MAFTLEKNKEIYCDKVAGEEVLREKDDIPATRESVQKTFAGLTEMINSNFATKQMNSTTIYDIESISDSTEKIIKMPKGFVLYNGVKFLVNVKYANNIKESLFLDLQLKDAKYIKDISLNRMPTDVETTTISNCIDESKINTVNLKLPIYLDFNKTSKDNYSLAKGLYIVEYVKDRILTSSEYLQQSDLSSSDNYDVKNNNLNYKNYRVESLPDSLKADYTLYTVGEYKFVIEKSTKYVCDITSGSVNYILKKVKINGYNFQTPSSTLITKTNLDTEKLYFTFTSSIDLWNQVATDSNGAWINNPSYKGSTKALWNVDAKSHVGKNFYYNSKKEKLYIPDTFFTGATQITTLNSKEIEFTETSDEGSPIYNCSAINNPYIETSDGAGGWSNSVSAKIDAFTYTGQAMSVMTQLIKKDTNREFFLGYFLEAKNSGLDDRYNSQQRIYINDSLSYNPGFEYASNEATTLSKKEKTLGKFKTSGSIEGFFRIKDSVYAPANSMLKIHSEDSYGLVSYSENKILSNDNMVMKPESKIYAENLDVKKDLIIGKYATVSKNEKGVEEAVETLFSGTATTGIKFGKIYNFNSQQNIGSWERTDKDDTNTDSDFNYALGIKGIDSRVYARRIDYNTKRCTDSQVDGTANDSSIKARRNLKTKIGASEKVGIGDDTSNGILNGASLATLETIYQATPKIAGTYDYFRGTSFWCPTSLTASTNDTGDVGVDELGNPNGDICTITTNFIAGNGDDNDIGSVGWISREKLLGGQSSFGWINNTTIKINSGLKSDGSGSIISNTSAINSPGKLYNTLKNESNSIGDSVTGDEISTNLNKESETETNGNDILVKFEKRVRAGDLLKAKEAEIQLTLGDSGVTAKTYGQSSDILTTSGLSSTSTSDYKVNATKPTKAEVLQVAALGQTITIPNITVNSKGIITSMVDKTIYIPTAEQILGYLNSARSQSITIKNSDDEVLATLDNTGELKISNAKCLQFGSLKVDNLEVEKNLLVPGKVPTGTSHWKTEDDKGNDATIDYSTSKRAIYAN